MGVETGWQKILSRKRPLRDDRGGGQQRPVTMLVAGGVLALVAIILAVAMPSPRSAAAPPTGPGIAVVVAAADIGFGEKLTEQKLKLLELPGQALPAGHFQRLDQVLQGPGHTAMRPIAAGEVLTAKALAAGTSRLSTAPLLNPAMRALSVPVDEITGVGGLLYPGDRVDVFLTRLPDEAMPHAELLAQDIRVLAVGMDMNIAREKPGVVKSAALELTPAQAQKLTLAAATGTIRLALRRFGDQGRIRLESLQVSDLNDGTPTRLIRKPGGGNTAPALARPTDAAGKTVTVMRGSETAQVPVLP